MGAATFLSRIAGLVREQTFAYVFGAGTWTDAFNVAFRIPNLLRDLFAEGAMSSAFVPTFNSVLTKQGKNSAFRLTNLTFSSLLLVVGAITLAGIALSPLLVALLAPDFASVPGKAEITVLMTRIMFPFLLVISLAAIAMGILNSLGEFFVPAIAPVFLNLAMIVAGFTLCPIAEGWGWPPIVGMAVGAMLGGILQLVAQLPALFRHGYHAAWEVDFRDPGLNRIGKLILPGTIGLAATQINVAVSTILATSQGEGAVSWLNYAFRLMQLPLGIFGVAIAQATLPVVSRQAASGEMKDMAATVASSIKLTAFINISSSLFLIALARPAIGILFEHGRFTASDTAATALALQAYAVGLFFFSLIKVLGPACYALGETKVPVRASFASVIVNILLNLALIKPCGYWGLALGSSVAAAVNALFLFLLLGRRLGGFSGFGLGAQIGKTLTVSALAAWTCNLVHPVVSGAIANAGLGHLAGSLAALGVSTLAGLLVLFVAAALVGISEVGRSLDMLLRKIRIRR